MKVCLLSVPWEINRQSLNWIQRLQWSHPEILTEPEDEDEREL
jgi:hypothetical protein